MEDVQLIKLDIDVDKIVDEVEHLNEYEYFRDASSQEYRTEFGSDGKIYADKGKEGVAYCHDGRARLQLPDHIDDPFYLVGGSRPEKHEKVSASCCRSYAECKQANLQGCTCKDDWTKPAFKEMEYTNQVMEELGMCKTGIAQMPPSYALPRHSDPHVKLHVPVKSNEDVAFLIKQEDKSWKAYTLPSDGNAYLVNVTKPHSVSNASTENRIHLVGELLDNSPYSNLIDEELR